MSEFDKTVVINYNGQFLTQFRTLPARVSINEYDLRFVDDANHFSFSGGLQESADINIVGVMDNKTEMGYADPNLTLFGRRYSKQFQNYFINKLFCSFSGSIKKEYYLLPPITGNNTMVIGKVALPTKGVWIIKPCRGAMNFNQFLVDAGKTNITFLFTELKDIKEPTEEKIREVCDKHNVISYRGFEGSSLAQEFIIERYRDSSDKIAEFRVEFFFTGKETAELTWVNLEMEDFSFAKAPNRANNYLSENYNPCTTRDIIKWFMDKVRAKSKPLLFEEIGKVVSSNRDIFGDIGSLDIGIYQSKDPNKQFEYMVYEFSPQYGTDGHDMLKWQTRLLSQITDRLDNMKI